LATDDRNILGCESRGRVLQTFEEEKNKRLKPLMLCTVPLKRLSSEMEGGRYNSLSIEIPHGAGNCKIT